MFVELSGYQASSDPSDHNGYYTYPYDDIIKLLPQGMYLPEHIEKLDFALNDMVEEMLEEKKTLLKYSSNEKFFNAFRWWLRNKRNMPASCLDQLTAQEREYFVKAYFAGGELMRKRYWRQQFSLKRAAEKDAAEHA